jgi:hypothetical protein
MKLRYLLIPVLAFTIVAGGTSVAFARQGSDDDNETASTTSGKREDRMRGEFDKLFRKSGPSIHINGGKAQLDAALVTDISGSDLTVKLFGLSYKVKTDSSTRFSKGTLSDIKVDSRIWVKGKVEESTGAILASDVRVFGLNAGSSTASTTLRNGKNGDKFEDKIRELLEKIKKLQGGN